MRRIVSLVAICVIITLVQTATSAQGRYRGRAYTKADVERIIKRVETQSDIFQKEVDRSLDRGVLDGTRAEDRINEQVKELERALDNLRSDFDRAQRYQETRSQVSRVLNEARDVNEIFHRRHLKGNIEREWAVLRAELNKLGGIYDLRPLRG